jgi:hypothetical protein
MRSHKLVLALALTASLAVPAAVSAASPADATAKASTCRVELNFVDAHDTDENNGDEIRINLAGYMYPNQYVAMNNGDRAYSGNFANPTTTIGTTGSALFSLREVTPPVLGQGKVLGSVTAWGFTCATLATGQVADIPQHIFGNGYWYYMSLVMTGL